MCWAYGDKWSACDYYVYDDKQPMRSMAYDDEQPIGD